MLSTLRTWISTTRFHSGPSRGYESNWTNLENHSEYFKFVKNYRRAIEKSRDVHVRRNLLAHTLSDDYSASNVKKKTRRGISQNLFNITLLQILGKIKKASGILLGNVCLHIFGIVMCCWWLFIISLPHLWVFFYVSFILDHSICKLNFSHFTTNFYIKSLWFIWRHCLQLLVHK